MEFPGWEWYNDILIIPESSWLSFNLFGHARLELIDQQGYRTLWKTESSWATRGQTTGHFVCNECIVQLSFLWNTHAHIYIQILIIINMQNLVVGFNPSEKHGSIGMIIPNIWENKKCTIFFVFFFFVRRGCQQPSHWDGPSLMAQQVKHSPNTGVERNKA